MQCIAKDYLSLKMEPGVARSEKPLRDDRRTILSSKYDGISTKQNPLQGYDYEMYRENPCYSTGYTVCHGVKSNFGWMENTTMSVLHSGGGKADNYR
jgi:hypothetical protein